MQLGKLLAEIKQLELKGFVASDRYKRILVDNCDVVAEVYGDKFSKKVAVRLTTEIKND